jgi:hypothetical protein
LIAAVQELLAAASGLAEKDEQQPRGAAIDPAAAAAAPRELAWAGGMPRGSSDGGDGSAAYAAAAAAAAAADVDDYEYEFPGQADGGGDALPRPRIRRRRKHSSASGSSAAAAAEAAAGGRDALATLLHAALQHEGLASEEGAAASSMGGSVGGGASGGGGGGHGSRPRDPNQQQQAKKIRRDGGAHAVSLQDGAREMAESLAKQGWLLKPRERGKRAVKPNREAFLTTLPSVTQRWKPGGDVAAAAVAVATAGRAAQQQQQQQQRLFDGGSGWLGSGCSDDADGGSYEQRSAAPHSRASSLGPSARSGGGGGGGAASAGGCTLGEINDDQGLSAPAQRRSSAGAGAPAEGVPGRGGDALLPLRPWTGSASGSPSADPAFIDGPGLPRRNLARPRTSWGWLLLLRDPGPPGARRAQQLAGQSARATALPPGGPGGRGAGHDSAEQQAAGAAAVGRRGLTLRCMAIGKQWVSGDGVVVWPKVRRAAWGWRWCPPCCGAHQVVLSAGMQARGVGRALCAWLLRDPTPQPRHHHP